MSRVIGTRCCVMMCSTAMRMTAVTVIFTMMLIRSLVSQSNVIARAAYQHEQEIDEQHAANDQQDNHPETPLLSLFK